MSNQDLNLLRRNLGSPCPQFSVAVGSGHFGSRAKKMKIDNMLWGLSVWGLTGADGGSQRPCSAAGKTETVIDFFAY